MDDAICAPAVRQGWGAGSTGPYARRSLLLLGTGGLTRKEVIDRYADLRHYPQLPNQDVAAFILKHKLGGKGIGWVDGHLLATASSKGLKLWTEEKNLRAVASTMKMAFEPGKT